MIEGLVRQPRQSGFAHLLLIIVVVIAVGIVGVLFYKRDDLNFGFWLPGSDLERVCCLECHNLVNPENKSSEENGDQKSCLKDADLSQECKEFFEKNPERETQCSNSELQVLTPSPTPTPKDQTSGDVGGLGNLFGDFFGQKCDHEYVWWRDLEEIEKKFKDKVWSGEFLGDYVSPDGSGYTYTVKVDDLHIVFDSEFNTFLETARSFKQLNAWTPCSQEAYYGSLGAKMAGSGSVTYSVFNKATKAASATGICDWKCTVTNNPIPINLIGRIIFTDEGVKLAVDKEKIGVDTAALLERCGQEDSSCDPDQVLEEIEIDMTGYCQGFYCNDDPYYCTMNSGDECSDNWQLNEIVAEGDVEFLNEKDMKLTNSIGASYVGDAEKEAFLTGILYLSD